ncbi:unnamed protein product, partial [Bubo scandiacus]
PARSSSRHAGCGHLALGFRPLRCGQPIAAREAWPGARLGGGPEVGGAVCAREAGARGRGPAAGGGFCLVAAGGGRCRGDEGVGQCGSGPEAVPGRF